MSRYDRPPAPVEMTPRGLARVLLWCERIESHGSRSVRTGGPLHVALCRVRQLVAEVQRLQRRVAELEEDA